MELKVACDCGQKYKFDVEPVEGRMPFAVNCPVCGVDGTSSANQLLEQHFAAVPAAPTPVAQPALATAGGLRINRPAPAAAPPPLFASTAAAAPPLPVSAPAPASRPGIPIRNLVSPPVKEKPTYNLWLGIAGALVGAGIGAGLVFGFVLWTGFKMPLSGTCVGLLSGFGARALARGGDATLGAIAATFSVMSAFCVFYFCFEYFTVGMIVSTIISGIVAYKLASY